MPEKKVGDLIDQLGIVCEFGDEDMMVDAIVVFRSTNFEDGESRFGYAYSKHTDFIVRRGLVSLLKEFEEMNSVMMLDDGEDD